MQFPVPQFTDVEDRIIGSLTLKQFGFLFGAGVVVFLAYSSSKSILVTIFVFLVVGVPCLAIAFVKINGRPMYNSFGHFLKFFLAPKLLVFHKEVGSLSSGAKFKDAQVKSQNLTPQAAQAPIQTTQSRLKEVNVLLQKQAQEEKELSGQIR